MNASFEKSLFPSGLSLISIPMPATKSVTAMLLVGAGSRYENKEINGISHFLEHMVFKGTKEYPNAQAIASAVDSVGAEFNAFTSKEYTGFYIKSSASHLNFALNMLSQLVFHPSLPSRELKKERGVIIEEINMYEDNPMAKIGRVFEKLLYTNTSLGQTTIGTKKNILSLRRRDFADYMEKWYQPQHMVLGVAGSFAKTSLKERVGNHFKSQRKRPVRSGLPDELRLRFSQSKPSLKVVFKKTKQTHLCFGVRSFARGHKMRYALGLLSTILGGNMSSRLFEEVREKRGLAYYVRTQNQYYLDNGYMVTQAGTDIKKAFDAVAIIKKQYGKLASVRHGLTQKELDKAKQYIKGKLVLALENSKEVAELYVEDQLLEGDVRTPEQIIKEIDKLELRDVLAVAKQIFKPENLNLAIIGPYKDKGKARFAKAINQ